MIATAAKRLAARVFSWTARKLGMSVSYEPGPHRFNWQGVYERFTDVSAHGVGFDDDVWAGETRQYTERIMQECARADRLPAVVDDNALLAMLLAVSSGAGASRLRVLDFGGGMGMSYVLSAASMRYPEGLEYHIVENPKICRDGARLFSTDERVHFHERIPESLPDLYLVYINSALQYVADYRGLLRSLCALSPRYVFLARCSTGRVPTYATAQLNHPGKRIAYWFINVDELVSILGDLGYAPIFVARGPYAIVQDNFEERYRIGGAANLLFSRLRP